MFGIRMRGSCQRQSGDKATQRKGERLFISRRNGGLSIPGVFEPLSFIAGDEKDDFPLLSYKIALTSKGDNLCFEAQMHRDDLVQH